MSSRTAILLFLPTTSHNLGWWVAHHLALGFSTLLIYDDLDQSDEAYQIRSFLQNARAIYDIRVLSDKTLSQTDFSLKSDKQEKAFHYLLKKESADFSWILPLSLDEYFWTEQDSLKDFFNHYEEKLGKKKFKQLNEIPINWCIFTSHNPPAHQENTTLFNTSFSLSHTLKISPENFPDHRITRSFFRPSLQETHNIPSPFAHLHKNPDWSSARILHDAAFFEINKSGQKYYQQTENLFANSHKFLSKTQNIAAELLHAQIDSKILHYLSASKDKTRKTEIISKAKQQKRLLNRCYITHLDSLLVLDHQTEKLTWRPRTYLDPKKETALCLAYFSTEEPEKNTPAWLYPASPLPHPFLTLKQPSSRSFQDLLPLIALQISFYPSLDETQNTYYFRALLNNEPLTFLGNQLCALEPISLEEPFSPPFLTLAYLLQNGLSPKEILTSLPNLPFICAGSFASTLINAIREENNLDSFSETDFISLLEKTMLPPEQISSPQSYFMESPFVFQSN